MSSVLYGAYVPNNQPFDFDFNQLPSVDPDHSTVNSEDVPPPPPLEGSKQENITPPGSKKISKHKTRKTNKTNAAMSRYFARQKAKEKVLDPEEILKIRFANRDQLISKVEKEMSKELNRIGLSRGKRLGAGTFGSVFLTPGTREFKRKNLAIKTLDLKPIIFFSARNQPYFSKSESIQHRQGEASALFLPKGAHLARAYKVLVYDHKTKRVRTVSRKTARRFPDAPVVATISRAQKHDLHAQLRQQRMATADVRGYGRNIAQAMAALHKEGYIHRDIKPPNILVKGRDKRYAVKLTDFGTTVKGSKAQGRTGSLGFMAPEVLLGREYNQKADVYSFGMTLYFMAARSFEKPSPSKIRDPQLRNLLFNRDRGLLNQDPNKRLSSGQILNHPFFTGHR